jgi:DNA-nicking Smr family endonuclease
VARGAGTVTSEKDREAFAKAMQGVKRMQPVERALESKRPPAKVRNSRTAGVDLLTESLNAPNLMDSIEQLGEEIVFRRSKLPEKVFRQLRKGRFSIEAEADLHGLTVPQAKLHLREFICESVEYRLGCVRVIHGKGLGSGPGGPVLKGKVQRWLAQWDEVLAFVTALARDGGSGAVYVLLQRR